MNARTQTFAFLAIFASAVSASAATIVNDTWLDGDRTDPAGYSEHGVDLDLDNNIESRWFSNPSAGLTASAGHLNGAVGTGSANWTTYFTDALNNPLNLADIGNKLTITWVFTPTTINVGNASQGFRMAVVQSPVAPGRLTGDGTPGDGAFAGYAIFQNFGPTLGRANNDNLDILERNVSSGNLLSTGGNWLKGAGGGTSGNEGFLDGTQYTFVFSAERTASGLQLDASFSGGNIDGDGSLTASYLDTTPNSYTFDTFALRPSSSTSAAAGFDTTLFRVEFVPEPSAAALLLGGIGLCGLIWRARRSV